MKKIMIKVGEFTTKDGVVKGKWEEIGVIRKSDNGKEYCLLNPRINLAGFDRQGKDNLMASIFEDTARAGKPTQVSQEADFDDAEVPF